MNMTINPTSTVRELVTTMPEATRIFERLGIDYCCGGSRTLAAACEVAGVSPEEAVRLLEELGAAGATDEALPDWRQESLAALIAHITDQHHQFTRYELDRLTPLLSRVCAVHGRNHSELARLRELFTELKEELTTHLLKEEQVLFPWVVRMEEAVSAGRPVPPPFFRTVNNPVRMMMTEHDHAGDLLRLMREVTDGYRLPADACFSYGALYQGLEALEADLHQHIHLENNLLFPRAIEMENQAASAWQGTNAGDCAHHCFSHPQA
ncbi:MAG TPA: iron-sulfur cluster repair di-iron protein [Blastocatellia bacterium]|nr:iron-sulfur cluster repair di-iron protein [Blastocatellia bacterium]